MERAAHKYDVCIQVEPGLSPEDRRRRGTEIASTACPSLKYVLKSHHLKRAGRVFYRSLQQLRARKDSKTTAVFLFYAITLCDSTHVVIGEVTAGISKQAVARDMQMLLLNARK